MGTIHRIGHTLRVFSNWDLTRVIIPKHAMYERRFSICQGHRIDEGRCSRQRVRWQAACVTPALSILMSFTFQLPVEMEVARWSVICSSRLL